MNPLVLWLEKISNNIGKLGAWLIIPLILALCYEVFARYLFRAPTIWAFDITYMLMAAIFLIAAAHTLAEQRHIQIDFLYAKFSTRFRATLDLLGFLLLFLPVVSYVTYFAWDKLIWSIQIHERSDITPWHPLMWPFRGCIAVGFSLLAIQGIAEVMKKLLVITGKQKG